MKALKFAAVCAAVVGLLGFTSCLKGDDNNQVTGGEIVKVDLMGLKTIYGATITPINSSILTEMMSYPYALVTYTYDRSTVTQGSTTVKATINGYLGISQPDYATVAADTVGMATQTGANSPIITLSENGETGWVPQLFTKELMFIPIGFYIKNTSSDTDKKSEINSHRFVLYFPKDGMKNGTLTCYVRHSVSNPAENKNRLTSTWSVYGFNISGALAEYKNAVGSDPERISFIYDRNTSPSGDYAGAYSTTYNFEYKRFVDNYFKDQEK